MNVSSCRGLALGGRGPLRQEDAERPRRQPACLVVGNSPEFSKERAKGGNGLQTLLPTLWAGRAHGASPNTDKVTQWSIGLSSRPWEPGHRSTTPGDRNTQKGPVGTGGWIWEAASNDPTGKQLCMGTGLQHLPVGHFESIAKCQAHRLCSFSSCSTENLSSRNTEAGTLVDSIGNAPS